MCTLRKLLASYFKSAKLYRGRSRVGVPDPPFFNYEVAFVDKLLIGL